MLAILMLRHLCANEALVGKRFEHRLKGGVLLVGDGRVEGCGDREGEGRSGEDVAYGF
ncbi:hypothetical protein [Streptomyces microflavus]|uniref:hypothetical protein n=1 Tax=Streptomyces microflavus TaxID=1919 RepID=UPI0033B2F336